MAVELSFDEILLSPDLFSLGGASGGPELANANIRSPITGVVRVAVQRQDPMIVWNLNFADVDFDIENPDNANLAYFNHIWYGGLGSAYGFRVRMEADFYTRGEVLGENDGTITTFKLTKKYNRPGTTSHPYYRRIIKPVVNTNLKSGCPTLYEPDGSTSRNIFVPFKVYLDEVDTATGWKVDNTTGEIIFDAAFGSVETPVEVSVDMTYDTPMQFFTNSFSQKNDYPAEISGLQVIEILPASLGIV